MTLAEAEIICDGWRDNPPAHHMMQILAGMWGWKPPQRHAPVTPMQAAEVLAIPGMSQKRDVHEGLGAPVLDIAQLRCEFRP